MRATSIVDSVCRLFDFTQCLHLQPRHTALSTLSDLHIQVTTAGFTLLLAALNPRSFAMAPLFVAALGTHVQKRVSHSVIAAVIL